MLSYKLALIGCGFMGRLHVEGWKRAGLTTSAVADSHFPLAQEVAAGIPECRAYADWQTMLDAEKPDIVSIATPPGAHRDPAVIAASRGIHVLCEKPMAGTLEDAREIRRAVSASRSLFMVGHWHRFHEPMQELRARIRAGELGDQLTIRSRFSFRPARNPRAWTKDKAMAGGGAVFNTAVHSLDIFRFLAGEVSGVQAYLPRRGSGDGFEDTAVLILAGTDGNIGIVEAYETAPVRAYEFWVAGSKAEARVGWDPPSLEMQTAENPEWVSIPVQAQSRLDRVWSGIQYFSDCLKAGKMPEEGTLEDGVRSIALVEAAYKASSGGVPPANS